jgi:hypothetical protein
MSLSEHYFWKMLPGLSPPTKCLEYLRIRGTSNQNVHPFLIDVSKIAYIDIDQYVYYSYALGEITTRNHKPQLCPQHNTVITMTKCRKM